MNHDFADPVSEPRRQERREIARLAEQTLVAFCLQEGCGPDEVTLTIGTTCEVCGAPVVAVEERRVFDRLECGRCGHIQQSTVERMVLLCHRREP